MLETGRQRPHQVEVWMYSTFLVGHLCTYITTAGCNPIKQGVCILIYVRSFLLSLGHILSMKIGMQYVFP
jgi:hypothetical protein